MKKQDLEKAKIYDLKTKKQVADLPTKTTPRTARIETDPKTKMSSIKPGGKLESPDLWKPDVKKEEVLKMSRHGQWKVEKNINSMSGNDQNMLTMSEKEMRSEVGDNREHDVRVKKTDPPQMFDNLRMSEHIQKAEMCKISANGQWKLTKAKNPDKKADADLGEKVEELVEEHAEKNKAAEREEGHKLLGKKEGGEKEEEYIHGLPKSHPALGHYKGYTYRRTRPPVKQDNRWQWAVRSPEGKDFKVHLPSETAGFAKDLHEHLDKLK